MVGKRAEPPPLPVVALWKVDPAPFLGSTVESTLLVEVWVNQSQSFEHWRDVPITYLSYAQAEERCPNYMPPSMPEAGGRAVSVILRVGELSLSLISCSIWESGPYATRGPHSKAGLEGAGGGEPNPRM